MGSAIVSIQEAECSETEKTRVQQAIESGVFDWQPNSSPAELTDRESIGLAHSRFTHIQEQLTKVNPLQCIH